jgi:5'-nucleotidase / UDP-sugar diphosphatase
MRTKRTLATCLLVAVAASCAHRNTDTVTILHTNDIHGHIRKGAEGVGGMAYVGAYIREVEARRSDTLVLDGGDINNKGDMLPGVTKGRALYEIMGMIGYDAAVPGNHDFVYGVEHLQNLVRWGEFPSLCLNAVDETENPVLPGSQIFDVDGVKVGVIGLTVQRSEGTLSLEDSCPLLAREAARLEPEAHLLVALCHLSSEDCAAVSQAVPAIDVFIGGHSHEALERPIVVEETGAIIIEAGDFARYVGRLKVKIDLDTEEVIRHKGKLVAMKHRSVPRDPELAAWIARQEREYCPRVMETVGTCQQEVTRRGMAKLLAAALLERADADLALTHKGTHCRGLPVGAITYNTLYGTIRLGEQPIVLMALTGQEILGFLEDAQGVEDVPQWAGFTADMAFPNPEESGKVTTTDLDPRRSYRVVLPEDQAIYLLKNFGSEARPLTPCGFTVSQVLLPYMARLGQEGRAFDTVAPPKPVLSAQSGG